MNSSGGVEEPVPEITMDTDKETEEVKKMRNTLWRGGVESGELLCCLLNIYCPLPSAAPHMYAVTFVQENLT